MTILARIRRAEQRAQRKTAVTDTLEGTDHTAPETRPWREWLATYAPHLTARPRMVAVAPHLCR